MRRTIYTVQIGETSTPKLVSKQYFDKMKNDCEAGYSYDLLLPECSNEPKCSIISYEGESGDYFGLVKLTRYRFNCTWKEFFEYIEKVFDWDIPKKHFDILSNFKMEKLGKPLKERYVKI
jgi:hypothetical protein